MSSVTAEISATNRYAFALFYKDYLKIIPSVFRIG
jgi:hypothetical protein